MKFLPIFRGFINVLILLEAEKDRSVLTLQTPHGCLTQAWPITCSCPQLGQEVGAVQNSFPAGGTQYYVATLQVTAY